MWHHESPLHDHSRWPTVGFIFGSLVQHPIRCVKRNRVVTAARANHTLSQWLGFLIARTKNKLQLHVLAYLPSFKTLAIRPSYRIAASKIGEYSNGPAALHMAEPSPGRVCPRHSI